MIEQQSREGDAEQRHKQAWEIERKLAEDAGRPIVIEHWHKLADRRRNVVFATGVGHSVHLRNEFARSGVIAEHLDGSTPLWRAAGASKRAGSLR